MADKRLYHEVADKIKNLILGGTYPPGSRLPGERELAEQFGVSRVTVREAEIALQAQGYLSIKTGSGVYVLDFDGIEDQALRNVTAFELTEARLLFESEAAALAAVHATNDDLEYLGELVEQIAYDNPDGEEMSQKADREFHLTIAAASGNKVVKHIIETLWRIRNEMPAIKDVHATICEIEDATNRHAEHAAVLDGLRARDPAAARQGMQEHFRRLLESMIDITETKAIEELRKSASERRRRYLASQKERRSA